MKKKILSHLMILCFAFAGLFMVGNNLMAETPPPETEDQDEHDGEDTGGNGGCEMTQDCATGICSILNAKKRFLANGCKISCGHTCTVQSYPWPF